MKRKNLALVAAGLVMIGAIAVRPAMAYFTDSHEAVGTATVYIGNFEIEPDEDAAGWTKKVVVKNTGNYDVFVRVQAICGEAYRNNLTYSSSKDNEDNDDWTLNDGYYQYNHVLKPGETSRELTINITKPDDFDFDTQTFNVVIVEEAAKAQYVNGVLAPKWDEKIMERQEYQAKFGEKNPESQSQTQPAASTETETQQTTETTENNEGGNE